MRLDGDWLHCEAGSELDLCATCAPLRRDCMARSAFCGMRRRLAVAVDSPCCAARPPRPPSFCRENASGNPFAGTSCAEHFAGSTRDFRSFLSEHFRRNPPRQVHRDVGRRLHRRCAQRGVFRTFDYISSIGEGVPLTRQWCCRPDCRPNAGIKARNAATRIAVDFSTGWVLYVKIICTEHSLFSPISGASHKPSRLCGCSRVQKEYEYATEGGYGWASLNARRDSKKQQKRTDSKLATLTYFLVREAEQLATSSH